MKFELIPIRKIDTYETNFTPVYDLTVENDHSYCVGEGIAVHNCLTRRVAGVGYPQLSAVIECADAAHGLGGHIIADGGCTEIGDIVKAFGAGADFVMLGSMFMGYDECAGNWSEDPETGIKSLEIYGMSSDKAMANHGGKQAHRASEGRCLTIPSKGSVEPFLLELQGGLRSACTYVGADKLKDLSKRTTFVRVNRQLNDAFRQD